MKRFRRWGRSEDSPPEAEVQVSPEKILRAFPNRLISDLAGLDGAPTSVIEATLQLQLFGSRVALLAYGVVVEGDEVVTAGPTSRRKLHLTGLGREVIAAAALHEMEPELTRRTLEELEQGGKGLPMSDSGPVGRRAPLEKLVPQTSSLGGVDDSDWSDLDDPLVLAADVSQGVIRLGLADISDRWIESPRRLEAQISEGMTIADIFTNAVKEIGTLWRDLSMPLENLQSVCIGVPGWLDKQSSQASIPAWNSTPFPVHAFVADGLSDTLNRPVDVIVENDANLGAIGELFSTHVENPKTANFLFVKASARVSVGIILDGRLYQGGRGRAGEIGQTPVPSDIYGVEYGDDKQRPWRPLNEVASLGATISSLQKASPDRFPVGFSSTDLLKGVAEGDEECLAAAARAGSAIGFSIASLVDAFDPDFVVLGGIMSRMGSAFDEPLSKMLSSLSGDSEAGHLPVRTAAYGEDAVLKGAVHMARGLLWQ